MRGSVCFWGFVGQSEPEQTPLPDGTASFLTLTMRACSVGRLALSRSLRLLGSVLPGPSWTAQWPGPDSLGA